MSSRKVTNIATSVCLRSNSKHRHVLQLAAIFSMDLMPPRPMHSSSAPNHRRGLRLEGIQGPLLAPLSVKESRKILEAAAKTVNCGFNLQGVQGALHTTETLCSRGDSASGSSRGGPGRKKGSITDQQIENTASPQGVQGDTEEDCDYFNTWLNNCRRYGLQDCDQQLQGIQSGRLTLAEVLAEQEAYIAEIAANYRKRAQTKHSSAGDESVQGTQGQQLGQVPSMDGPTPQGVQGEDCVRFRLWLENCHRFGLHECTEQLQGFQSGRTTLKQIFEEQDALIRKVVEQYKKKPK